MVANKLLKNGRSSSSEHEGESDRVVQAAGEQVAGELSHCRYRETRFGQGEELAPWR